MIKHAVELFFDPATEKVLRAELERLRDAGLPSPLLEWGTRPHVSLLLGTDMARGADEAVAAFAADVAPLAVTLDVLGTFAGEKRAVLLLPVVTQELLALHANAYDRLGPFFGELDPHYAPGRWVAHCTQSIAIEEHELEATMRLLRSTPLPIAGRFASIGVHRVTIDPELEGRARIVGTDYPVLHEFAG